MASWVDPSIASLVDGLKASGVELWHEGDRLRFRAPKGALGAAERERLAAERKHVVAYLQASAGGQATAPMSFSQRSLWFLHTQAPDSTAYHLAMAFRVRSSILVPALNQSLQALVDRHAILRTRYALAGEEPRQIVSGSEHMAAAVHEVPGIDDAALKDAVQREVARPFDLTRGPVLRASLYTRGPADHVVLLVIHHVAADGWSMTLLFKELMQLYEEAAGGPPALLPRPALKYTDYAAWQEKLLAGPEGERMWAYWERQLALPRAELDLPSDRPRPAVRSQHGSSMPLAISPGLTSAVRALAGRAGVTPFTVLLAGFKTLLHRLTGVQDLIVGTPTFARSKQEFLPVIGDFVNSVPLRSRLDPAASFMSLLQQLKQTVGEALDAQEYPLPLLVQRLKPERTAGRSPLFDTFFAFQRFEDLGDAQALFMDEGNDATPVDAGGLRLAPYPLAMQEGQFDLTAQIWEYQGQFSGSLKYATDLFDHATVERFAAAYIAILEAAVQTPDLPLREMPAVQRPEPQRRARELLDQLTALDVRLFLDDGKLRVNAPKGAITPALKSSIAEQRDAIVALLGDTAAASGRAQRTGTGIRRIEREGLLPVSSAQQRFWFLDRMQPGQSQYNIGVALRVNGPLDPLLLRQVLDAMVSRHESLRTRIIDIDGTPHAQVDEPITADFESLDAPGSDTAERYAAALTLAAAHMGRPFVLAHGSLARFLLVGVGHEDFVFNVVMHHIVSDGLSVELLLRDVFTAHDALRKGLSLDAPGVLAPLRAQYVDYAAWEAEQLHVGVIARQLAWWKQVLDGAPAVLELPTDRPRPAVPTQRGGRVRRTLARPIVRSLKDLSRRLDATLFMTLLAAWQVLLHRYSGQEDLVVGTPMANRNHPAFEELIGCMVNNIALRARLHGNPSFERFLAQVKETTLGALENRELPFDVLIDGLHLKRTASHAPLFQVLFSLITVEALPKVRADGISGEWIEIESDTSRYDLALDITEFDGELIAYYEYSSDLFDESTIERMHGQFEHLLGDIVRDSSQPIGSLALLPPAQRQGLLQHGCDNTVDHDRTRCVHDLLSASARSHPDAVAVVADGVETNYAELEAASNRLARLLISRGVQPGSLVAICVDRGLDMPVAMAAVLKAGAAYVPLDPTHPADRLRYMLSDAAVSCTITVSAYASLFDGQADPKPAMVLLDEAGAELAALAATPPLVQVEPQDRAYVIYTSGSTGRPKGVQVEHRNVVAFLEAMRRAPGMTANDALLAVTTLSFDIAGLEIWLPLMLGARIVIASRAETLDGTRLAAMLLEHRITVMQATPATFRLMLDAGWSGKPDLKVLCGGEALPRDLVVSLVERIGELWNVYGPTETTIWSTACRITDPLAPIVIGKPIHNTRCYILETSGSLAPIGVPGELCIGGEGVARGYLERPELTAEKFISITLQDASGASRSERIYRTGDMARWRSDGQLEFIGRRDHQVKVRGYRIELGEIETVLTACEGVKESVVVVREDKPGDQRLVAYVLAAPGATPQDEQMRSVLRERLPEYMVPNLFVAVAAFPLTPNGKIDRKSLPAPVADTAPAGGPSDAGQLSLEDSLMTPVQRRVAGLWRDTLRSNRVGLHDNFFDLGGHSLLLVKLHAALKREFDSDLQLVELFQRTTVASQAEKLTSASRSSPDALRRAQARAERQASVC